MGRPESPLTGPPRRIALAAHLREMRDLAGITYAEMALHPLLIPEATLKRTASDRGGVPRWHRVEEYRDICIDLADKEVSWKVMTRGMQLRTLWVAARMEERGTLHLPRPRPQFVVDQADLSHALYSLYEHQGAPPLRELQELAGGAVHLPLTTAARVVKRQTLPADEKQYTAFLRGCRVHDRRQPDWFRAWEKVVLSKHRHTAPMDEWSDEHRHTALTGKQFIEELFSRKPV
ncbi:hypothetical protein [Streptomyces ipomoeae]|uniref:Uncharacterized protein n=1 Tax=Streptomyces ipomoeae 91-03 TaxID=698759 RepID=L1KXM0_9ACTN|nr:hypothetical protein [Streptomyces ipomoeae]EKX65586.1 hypothetical protein STRIP9103_09686 [Streptomyces ipomoeae 91-03]MDX2842113.1 hypothetical protein [Streptomyces ipomoeae]